MKFHELFFKHLFLQLYYDMYFFYLFSQVEWEVVTEHLLVLAVVLEGEALFSNLVKLAKKNITYDIDEKREKPTLFLDV